MTNMKTELQKQLEQAQLEKIRAIDRVKEIKSQIAEAEKEPSIFELMPIGSVWCGREVMEHDSTTAVGLLAPIKIKHWSGNCDWPTVKFLHKLIAEQRKLDAMKKAADAALGIASGEYIGHGWFINQCDDYKRIIEQEYK
jgi:hypothetical protein